MNSEDSHLAIHGEDGAVAANEVLPHGSRLQSQKEKK